MIDKRSDIVNELAVLYELSLSIGSSLDVGQNCSLFIKTLVNKKNLDYGAVYLNANLFNLEEAQYIKFFSMPQNNLDADAIPTNAIPIAEPGELVVAHNIPNATLETGLGIGTYAIFSLGELGFVKLFSKIQQDERLSTYSLKSLSGVFLKFETSIKGSLAHNLLENEIVNRKKSERKLRKRNLELKKLNIQLDQFVYSASHDLRAPLVSVLGLIHILEKSDKKEDFEYAIGLLKSNIEKLDDFIQDIIEITRNSRLQVKSEPIDLSILIGEIFHNLKFLKYHKKIKEKIEVIGPEQVQTDPHRLKVVLNNIIGNALKYADPDADNPFITIECRSKPHELQISVKDNGIGISQDHLIHVFDMFYRATDKNAGSGLGLYIAKETIERMGGEIEIKSEIAQGTNVKIKIPLN